MKIAPFALTMLVISAGASAEPVAELSREPRVVAAMTEAWIETALTKVSDAEAGFSVDRSGDDYHLVPTQPGSFRAFQTDLRIVPGVTMAIFHVHPSMSDPMPSPADREIAEKYGVQMYIMHVTGLYLYDPVSRQTTKLRDRMSWLKP